MRARYPDVAGHIERDGVKLGYEVFGRGDPTILLLPTWTIVHSRSWKMQVPYLARHTEVVTYDGPGNGRSDRVTDPDRYSPTSYAADAIAVMDACRVRRAVVVGVSLGAQYGAVMAARYPDRVEGLVMIGTAMPLTASAPERSHIAETFHQPYPADASGWAKYNLAYWHDHYRDFAEFFFAECFSEPHSTKPIEDTVGWAMETTPEVLGAEAAAPQPIDDWPKLLAEIQCPTLVIHGTDDRIHPFERGVEAARLTDGSLIAMDGSGHIPLARDPVRVNLALREFLEALRG